MNQSRSTITAVAFGLFAVALLSAFSAAAQAQTSGTWNTTGTGNWSDPTKWLNGIVADGTNGTATFSFPTPTDATITLDSARTIGNLTFAGSGDLSLWIIDPNGSNDPLTLAVASGTPTITNTNGGNASINVVLAGSQGLTKAGEISLFLNVANTYTGGTTITGGALQMYHAQALSTGAVSVTGGMLNVTNGIAAQIASLSVGGGAGSASAVVQVGSSLTSAGAVQILSNGTLNVAGDFTAPSLDRSAGSLIFNTGSITINGGTYTHSLATGTPANILALAPNSFNNPLLELAGGASAVGVEAAIVGQAADSQGRLKISGGSVLNMTGTNITLATVEGVAIQRGEARIALAAGSSGGATVTGAGSQWNMDRGLIVGNFGSGTLDITSGGVVSALSGNFGFRSGSSGTVTVSGTGSQLNTTSAITVGDGGTGSLVISAGGVVSSSFGVMSNSGNSTSSATITGANSRWTTTGAFEVGKSSNATLLISAGGRLSTGAGTIGEHQSALATATVTGTGSQWTTNAGDLIVGHIGGLGAETPDSLTIADGGAVSSVAGYIGNNANSKGSVSITGVDSGGTASQWTASGFYFVGRSGTGTLNVNSGGKLTVSDTRIGSQSTGQGTATVNGAGSSWATTFDVVVGDLGKGTLNVENGGLMTSGAGFLAYGTNSTGTVTVTGAGSSWTSTGSLNAGRTGSATFTISAGGVASFTTGTFGTLANSNGTVVITGAGSQMNATGNLIIGSAGTGSLTVSAGGRLSSGTGFVGGSATGLGTATVTGTGSQWTTGSNDLVVGQTGNGAADTPDTLTIADGGAVSSVRGYIGNVAGAKGAVSITGVDLGGTASQWTASSNFLVGYSGIGALSIMSGGKLSASAGRIGETSTGDGTVTLNGAGSQWTMTADFIIGNSGKGTLNVQNGAVVNSTAGFLGYVAGATGTVTVTGAGSQWNSSQTIFVGRAGTGTINVLSGGVVTSAGVQVGSEITGNGTVLIDGAGSRWTTTGGMFVGNNQTGKITVQNGGRLDSTSINIGGSVATSAGEVVVTGAGTQLVATGGIFVGISGLSGTLTVADGATLTTTQGINMNAPGTFNFTGGTVTAASFDRRVGTVNFTGGTLTVDGGLYTHSVATNTAANILVLNGNTSTDGPKFVLKGASTIFGVQAVVLGSTQKGALEISGGRVLNNTGTALTLGTVSTTSIGRGYGYLGLDDGSTGAATVTGAGSQWNNTFDLYVGYSGTGSLDITAGAVVTARNAAVSQNNFSAGSINVTGTNSRLTLSGTLIVAAGGATTSSLTIGAGGAVSATSFAQVFNGGSVNLQPGGTLTASSLRINDGTLNYSGGTLSAPVQLTNYGVINVAAGAALSLANVSGGGALYKTGTGSLALSGTNTHGFTSIEAGYVTHTGSSSAGYNVATQSALAQLHAAGTISGDVNVTSKGTFSAGTSAAGNQGAGIGNVTVSGMNWDDGSRFVFDFARTNDGTKTTGITDWDYINVSGPFGVSLSTSGRYTIEMRSWTDATGVYGVNSADAFDPSALSYKWLWLENFGGFFNGFADSDKLYQFGFDTTHFYPAGGPNPEYLSVGYFWVSKVNDDLYINYSAVPEPSSMLLIGVAGLGLAAHRRRRLRRQAALQSPAASAPGPSTPGNSG